MADDRYQPMDTAPKDGTAILGYGRHTTDAPPGASRAVVAGDHWWAIMLWDVWRPHCGGGAQWVFAKDGKPVWSEPLCWQPLLVPAGYQGSES